MDSSLRVTEGLGLLGFKDEFGDELAMSRGNAVHLATAYWDLGVLDESTVDPVARPFLDGYREFRRDMPGEIPAGTGMDGRAIEEKVKGAGMTGTLDRRYIMGGAHWLYDIKTGSPRRWHRWQACLYSNLWSMTAGGECRPRPAILYLTETGKYRWVQFENWWRDLERAKALITAAHIAKEIHDGDAHEVEAAFTEERV